MTDSEMWEADDPVSYYGISIPQWIDQTVSPSDVAAIMQGGCASGAYMPAVTYHEATDIMSKHGDDVMQFIYDEAGELPKPTYDMTWSRLASFYLSHAVELWASGVYSRLESLALTPEVD